MGHFFNAGQFFLFWMSSQFLFVFFGVRGVYLTRSSRLSQGFVYAGLKTALQGLGFGFSVVGSESRGYGMACCLRSRSWGFP